MKLAAGNRRLDIGRTITLADGRVLGFAEFGPTTGTPLFFFHGGGSTRLTRHPDDCILDELDARLVTIDRPGVGLSDYQPRRRLLDWPDDIACLADRLGIDRFAVLGWSAGGPHALACAYKIPDRLQAAGVMSGLAPLHWPGCRAAVGAVLSRLLVLVADWAGYPTAVSSASPSLRSQGIPREVRAVHQQRLRDIVQAREWQRAAELSMLFRPWGFPLPDITTAVHLWYGSRDNTTPLYMARYLHHAMPSSYLTVWRGEGHHAGFTHWREIVGRLAR